MKASAPDMIPMRLAKKATSRGRASECPNCAGNNFHVKDTRAETINIEDKSLPTTRRRRECKDCNHRWTTYEVPPEIYELGTLYAAQPSRRDSITTFLSLDDKDFSLIRQLINRIVRQTGH